MKVTLENFRKIQEYKKLGCASKPTGFPKCVALKTNAVFCRCGETDMKDVAN